MYVCVCVFRQSEKSEDDAMEAEDETAPSSAEKNILV